MNNTKLYDMTLFHNADLDTPSKNNQLYLDMLKEFDEKYPELSAMGIYAIRYEGNLIYVGKATHIAKRWLAHTFNANHSISREYNRAMYIILRHLFAIGEVTFEVLETTDDKFKLDYLEAYYINKYMPCLNKKIPKLIEGSKAIYISEMREVMPTVTKEQFKEIKQDLIEHRK